MWGDQYWYKPGISTTIKEDLKDIVAFFIIGREFQWIDKMSKKDKRYLKKIAGRTFRELGYSY